METTRQKVRTRPHFNLFSNCKSTTLLRRYSVVFDEDNEENDDVELHELHYEHEDAAASSSSSSSAASAQATLDDETAQQTAKRKARGEEEVVQISIFPFQAPAPSLHF